MTAKCFFIFLLMSSPLWAESPFTSFENGTRINTPIPTFKEQKFISAQDVLSSATFTNHIYEESQSFSSYPYWHKLTFPKQDNTSNPRDTIHLSSNYYVIEHLDFYLFHGNELIRHWKAGALDYWHDNPNHYKGIWIPISLSKDQETTLLIRKQGNSPLLTPFKLFDNASAKAQKDNQLIFWTFIISSLSILLAHNVFVFILLRQPGFIYYLALNVALFIALSAITGFNRWIFSTEVSQWIIKNLFTIFGAGAWILFRFSVHFLKDIQIPSPTSLIRKYGDAFFMTYLVLTQVLTVKSSALLFGAIEAGMFVICTYWGIKAYQMRFIAVRFYLFSWFILITGSILNTFIFWKILPINFLTESIFPIASILQLLGFSFALADKAKQFERNRKLQTLTDIATGLPNRTYYFDKLPKLLPEISQNAPQLAIIMIEISNHQALSQAFGPAKADSAINEAIKNIHNHVLNMDDILTFPLPNQSKPKVIRITATNVVLLSKTPDKIKQQVSLIQQILDAPTLLNKLHFRHQYKIGSALYPSQGSDLDKLYQNALIANLSVTYSSGNWAAFTDSFKNNHAYQLNLFTQLTEDIKTENLYFQIQPQVSLADKKIIGGEALIRWNNKHLGPISPAEFIPLAEQTGLIFKLTDLLLEKVFSWASLHPKLLHRQHISVNISAQDLLQEGFAKRVIRKLQNHQLAANTFTIEITETSVFHNNNIVDNNVKQLHQAGFKLSIDDFGVGYSSMQNLVALATDELKIDQFFVMNLLHDPHSQTLCRNMIDLCKALNIVSVAEGIESEEVLQILQDLHCQVGQGYYLYKPMSPTEYLALLD